MVQSQIAASTRTGDRGNTLDSFVKGKFVESPQSDVTTRLERLLPHLKDVRVVLFDFDGVLSDDCQLGNIAYQTLKNLGVEIDRRTFLIDGKLRASSGNLFKNLSCLCHANGKSVSPEEARIAFLCEREVTKMNPASCIAAATLRCLKRDLGLTCGIISSWGQEKLETSLKALPGNFTDRIFKYVIGVDRAYPSKAAAIRTIVREEMEKSDLKANQIVYIGDMKADMQAATEAGVTGLGVIAPMDRGAKDIAAEVLYNNGAAIVLEQTAFLDHLFRVVHDCTT